MHDNLIRRLRALSRHEHSDLSIGDEAADVIAAMANPLASVPADAPRVAKDQPSGGVDNYAARIHREMVLDNNEIAAMADLAHEYEELREDAERFRFCRDRAAKCDGIWVVAFQETITLPPNFTAACDAARKEWEA